MTLFWYISSLSPPSDSFDLFVSTDNNTKITFDRTNIAWDTDRSIRFQNPGGSVNLSADTLINTTMPPNWPKNLSEITGGLQNESLMVWFRVSAFPWFRKLYGRPAVNGNENAMLPSGNYSILLTYSILTYVVPTVYNMTHSTVKPPIKDTLEEDKPPNKGHTKCTLVYTLCTK